MIVGYADKPYEVYETSSFGTVEHVLSVLREKKVTFGVVVSDIIREGRYDWPTGTWKPIEGFFDYFMKGNLEVAQYCPRLQTLKIWRVPRIWPEAALWQALDISGRYVSGRDGFVPAHKF